VSQLRGIAAGCETAGVALTIIHDDAQNCFAILDDRVLLQVRDGLLTREALDAAEQAVLPVLESQTRQVGALAIINGDAGVMPADVQARQREVIGRMLKRPNAQMATVMLGSTVLATASRAVGRVLLIGNRNIKHAKDVNEATTWLAERLGDIPAAHLRDAVAAVQNRKKPR
jgi:hypothetical protein